MIKSITSTLTLVNVFCLFDSGKGYYEGGLSADVEVSSEEGYVFADSVKIKLVEDEDENEIEFACDAKKLESQLEELVLEDVASRRNTQTKTSAT